MTISTGITKNKASASIHKKSENTYWRWVGVLFALLGTLPHVHLPDGIMLNLTGLKMFSSALAPLLGTLSGAAAWLGWHKRDRLAGFLGLLGCILSGVHVARLTAHHTAFEQGLGDKWRREISTDIQSNWLQRRYTPPHITLPNVPWERNITFAIHKETGTPLLADLWRPPVFVETSGIGIIYLHNSAWHYMDKDVLTRPWFRYLAGQGHVVMDVAYSLAPHNTGVSGFSPLHAMLFDVKRAIVWLKANAQQYNVNAKQIVLMGTSAGGHLALLAAYTPQVAEFQIPGHSQADTSVCGVVSLYGISDLESAHHYFQRIPTTNEHIERALRLLRVIPSNGQVVGPPRFIPSILGDLPSDVSLHNHPGSPLNHVGPHCPPTLLIHGSHDFGVEVTQSRILYQALCIAKIPAVFVELADADHAFELFFMEYNPAFQAALFDVERFLSWLGCSQEACKKTA